MTRMTTTTLGRNTLTNGADTSGRNSYLTAVVSSSSDHRMTPYLQQLCSDYEGGKTVAQLAYRHRRSTTSINRDLHRAGTKMRAASLPKHLTPESNSKIVELRRAGKKQSEIAAMVGCCQHHVSRVLVKAGLRTRDYFGRLVEREAPWELIT